jgi:hypothetical protein
MRGLVQVAAYFRAGGNPGALFKAFDRGPRLRGDERLFFAPP